MLAGLLIVLAVSIRLIVRVPAVQTWLVQRVTGYLSDELNTNISISAVDIRLFRSVDLKDIYIEDLQHDTLLYAKNLEAKISTFNWEKRLLVLKSIHLDKARIGVKHYASPRNYNIDFLIDYFSSDTPDTSASEPWKVRVENIYLTGNTVTYRDLKYDDKTRCVDFEDIKLTQLNVHLTDLQPEGDSVSFNVRKISFLEKSGFVAKGFEAAVTIHPDRMNFKNLHITTPYSEVNSDLEFRYTDFSDFQDFIPKVIWNGEFRESVLSGNDLCYFASEFFGVDRKVAFHGKVKGTVDRFKARDLEIRYSPTTYFRGSVNMTGLPDFDETYMEIGVNELSMKRSDLLTIPVIPGDSGKLITVPENIGTLGQMKFKGKFNGFYNDFVAYGNISTALGYASTDLNLKISDQDRNTTYKGSLKLHEFDMGAFWKLQPDIGLITMDVNLKGRGVELNNVDAMLEGTISRMDVEGYPYSGITIGGQLKRKLFSGNLEVKDPNVELDFSGNVDFNRKLPQYNFEASIRDAYLQKLKIIDRDSSAKFSGELSINMIGNTIDNAQGIIEAQDLSYSEKEQQLHVFSVALESVISNRRELKLRSDFADAQLTGNFTLSDLPKSFQWLISTYVPAIRRQAVAPLGQEITYRARIKESKDVTAIFFPDIKIAPNTLLEGTVNTTERSLQMTFNSDMIAFRQLQMDTLKIDGSTNNNKLLLTTNVNNLELNDSIHIRNLEIDGYTDPSSALFNIDLKGKDPAMSRALFSIHSEFPREGMATMRFETKEMMLNGNVWTLDTANYVEFDKSYVKIENFNLASADQGLMIGGVAGKDTSDKLSIHFQNFYAQQLNPVLLQYNVQLSGKVNGDAEISAIMTKSIFQAKLHVDTLQWFQDTLGNADVVADYNIETGIVDVDAVVTRGGDKNIIVDGKYIVGKKEDELDFNITLQKTYISSFSHYVEGIFSNLSGVASANLKLKGPVKKPLLTGKATLQKASLTVDYLKTAYTFNAELDLDEKSIRCRNVTINDIKGNKGKLDMNIFHNNLDDFYFDIHIEANNMQALNTTMADNDVFYGVAYASGKVDITGYVENIEMKIGLESEKGTKINIPLSNPEEISQSTFISFVKHDSLPANPDSLSGPDFSGITLDMDFEVTPEATIAIIFDDKIGDVIEGSGKGNLTMTMSPSEDFRMYGNIEIVEGKYLFTMQNIINKPFVINPGGFLRWNGDPYDAEMKIDAVYKLKTGLYDLFQDSTMKKLVPVDLELHLKDKLFNPSISFDIIVQNVDPTVENQVKRLINTEEEKYRQAMALLVMRRFVPPAEYSNKAPVNSGGVVGANAYELLSNQLTNWVNGLSNNVNVGVNYRPGDALTSEELEVALSTTILNDRVTIDGNVGYANTTNSNNQNTSDIVGDFNVEVKASKDGRVRFKAFNRSNNNTLINNVNSQYTQGIGVFYREEFNNVGELMRKYGSVFKKKEKETEVPAPNDDPQVPKPDVIIQKDPEKVMK